MKILILITVVLVLASCQTKTQKSSETTPTLKTQPAEPVVIEENFEVKQKLTNEESFMQFFSDFMFDQNFQKNRIIFPININDSIIESKNKWNYNRFYMAKSFMPILHADTTTYFDKDVSVNVLKMSIISLENHITENYNFKRMQEGWKLINMQTQNIYSIKDVKFLKFLTRFSSDSIYQKEHVAFPLPDYHVDYDNDYETIYDSTEIANWSYLDLNISLQQLMTLNLNEESNYRTIFFRGIENGIYVQYTFMKLENEWKLVKLEDYST